MQVLSWSDICSYTLSLLYVHIVGEVVFSVRCLAVCSAVCVCSVQALKNVVLYVLLAPFDNEQSDLVHRVYEEKKLQELPLYRWGHCRVTGYTGQLTLTHL